MRISVFSDLALHLAVGGRASTQTRLVGPSCYLTLWCFKHVWHRFLGCLSLLCGAFHALFLFLSSSSVVCSSSVTSYLATALRLSTSASLHLETELLSARSRASVRSGPCCESTSRTSVSILALVESRHFLRNLDRHHIDKKFPGCPHSTWDIVQLTVSV